ncbi:MAG: phospholipase A [Gammaproteobacteria bacterium]|nr:phospholipase A [Gammaproteobacteria bacterium]
MYASLKTILVFIVIYVAPFPVASAHAINECLLIDNDTERLECYDEQQQQPIVQPESIVEERFARELESSFDEFVITPHKPNYILPLTYNDKLDASNYTTSPLPGESDLQKVEVKFQLSLKVPLAKQFITSNGNLWFAYSQLSFWQLYNSDISSPFRETNYEPELMWALGTDNEIFGMRNSVIAFSLNHQSNGRAEPLSRSWNRIIANFIFDKDKYVFSFRPWYRIPESEEDDDNPDIHKYMGYGELAALYKYKKHQTTVMLRNNLDFDDNRNTVELTYTFPINIRLKGIAQYFNGYGESLIDYNHHSHRIGVGILLTDWL